MDNRRENAQEQRPFTVKDMAPLFQRNDWGTGPDVGKHIGSPGWIEKSKDHILGARNAIFASEREGDWHDLYMILSQYMTREERGDNVFHTYKDEPDILKTFEVWHEKGIHEKITGHYFHGLGALKNYIENIINRIFAKPSDKLLIPDFEECKRTVEEIREWWVNDRKFLECEPLFGYLLNTIAHVSQMNPETDYYSDTAMHLVALYSHARDIQNAMKKVREKQSSANK